MAKQGLTGRAPGKRTLPRKSAGGASNGLYGDESRASNENVATDENVAKHTEMARGLLLESWAGIVEGLIKKAKTGGYQQTKLLLDLCEMTNVNGALVNDQRRQQLCDVLLEGLSLSRARTLEPEPGEKADDVTV